MNENVHFYSRWFQNNFFSWLFLFYNMNQPSRKWSSSVFKASDWNSYIENSLPKKKKKKMKSFSLWNVFGKFFRAKKEFLNFISQRCQQWQWAMNEWMKKNDNPNGTKWIHRRIQRFLFHLILVLFCIVLFVIIIIINVKHLLFRQLFCPKQRNKRKYYHYFYNYGIWKKGLKTNKRGWWFCNFNSPEKKENNFLKYENLFMVWLTDWLDCRIFFSSRI